MNPFPGKKAATRDSAKHLSTVSADDARSSVFRGGTALVPLKVLREKGSGGLSGTRTSFRRSTHLHKLIVESDNAVQRSRAPIRGSTWASPQNMTLRKRNQRARGGIVPWDSRGRKKAAAISQS